MSTEYNNYLNEHIANVNKALIWMADNLSISELGLNHNALSQAIDEAHHHDESKYSNQEYGAYDAYFYGGNRSFKVVQEFNYAWLHHIHHNPHHWQYWVLFEDDPENGKPYKALEMPDCYILEMIADWWSFSWKSGNLKEIFDWYDKHCEKMVLADRTKMIVERIMQKLRDILTDKKEETEDEVIEHSDEEKPEDDEKKYGIPEIKKFPMPDADHVKSAIRFFNYVDPKYEKELAEAILDRIKEYGIILDEDISVGDGNRFKKYIPEDEKNNE